MTVLGEQTNGNIWIRKAMSFFFLLGATAMPFHYRTILETNLNCPVTVAHGPSGTRKTTALLSELSLF